MFYIFIFFLGAGISQVLSDSSEEVNDSQMSASALNRRWLKSKSAGQDLSFRSVNENEEPDSPNIPSDFDAKYGLDKTRFKRTPYPILSRRASYEDYGRAPDQGESIKTDEISFDFSSSKSDKVSSAKPKMTLQSKKETISTKKVAKTLKTLEKSIKPTAISVFLTTRQSNPINEAKVAVSQPKLQSKETKVTQKLEAIKEKDVLKPMKNPKTDSEFGKEKNNIPPKVDLNKIQTASSAVITLQPKHHPKTQLEVKPPTQSAAEGKTSVSNQENPKLPKSPLQTALPETEKGISMSQTIQGSTEKEELFPPTSTQITEFQAPLTTSPVTEFHMVDFLTSPSGIDTTPVLIQEVHTIRQAMQQTVSQNSPQHVPQKPSIHSETLEAKEDEAALPKLNRPKGRRTPGRIVLKPPPEDWPQPEGLQGAKEIPVPPEFTAKIPPMGTSVDSGKRKSGFKAESFVSPPYMGHRKIDLVPIPERPSTINKETNETIAPSMKWKIRGRKSRPTYGAYQRPGLSVSLTMKPSVSQFFISDNFTFVTPSARSTRQFRTYINFRQRGPMNVGRFFGPPPPPQPFPQPPPQHFHNHPFNQAPFPQHPQYPQPPFPVFPRGPPPPPPHFRPPPHPRFGQGRAPPPFAPPPPFPQGPPPPPPHFQRGPPPPPQFGPPPAQPFQPPLPPGPLPSPLSDVPAPPPSPYPTGVIFPTVRPFYENIPTISPIDNVPAPWPRRQVFMGTFQPKTFVPRNFSAYRGPRRGKAYEQFGKADLRPKKIRGSGFGMEFQTDVTRGPYVPGPMFMRKTWPTRENRFGYEPYRRSSDRKRPFGGFGRYGGEKPPVLGDFGQFKPYRRLDFGPMKSVYNFSRPTRSYTFPPRLRMAIRNATYQRRSFRRFDRDRFDRQSLGHIPSGTAKSYGLADNIAHDHAHYGNLITRKGRIMNLEHLRRLFTAAPIEPEPVLEGVEAVEEAPVVEAMESLTATPIVEAMKMVTAARLEGLDSEIVTVLPEETVNKILEEWMKGKPQAKPVGMTAKEALRAAAREAIRDTEKEAYDRGETIGGGLGRRRKGGFRPRGERGRRRSRGSGGFRFGTGARNFRRAKRSVDEDEGFLERQKRVRRELRLDYISESGDYLTGPGARSRSSSSRGDKKGGDAPLRMRRFHRRRGKGRPLRWG